MESVLTVGMGLTLAIGVISIFGTYQDQITSATEEKEIETIHYEVKSAVYSMKGSDTGNTEIDIPEDVGGMNYNLALDGGIRVITPEGQHISQLNNMNDYNLQGSVQGGTVTLYKSGKQYTLRSS